MTLALSTFISNDSRVMYRIGRGANIPFIEYNKDKVEGHNVEVQGILSALDVPNSPLDETIGADRRTANLAPVDPHDTAAIPAPESGMPLVQSPPILYRVLIAYFSTQHSSLWTFDRTHVCSARTPLPNRDDTLE